MADASTSPWCGPPDRRKDVGQDFKDLFGDWEPSRGGEGLPGGRSGEPENAAARQLHEKQVNVVGVFEHSDPSGAGTSTTFVLLQDNRGRKVPIWIGKYEAVAISVSIEGEQFERPMTHDLMKVVVDRLGAEVDRVIIDDLWNDTFYAKLTLVRDGNQIEIDCRPSDALALAVRTKSPIYIAESVIEGIEQKL
jgi:bifunctional DNase/RNase